MLPFENQYFGAKIQQSGYAVYEFIAGHMTQERWSAASLDIHVSPKHYHRIEHEIFIVVKGMLDIEMDGVHHLLATGEAVGVKPSVVHQLLSATEDNVQVLCFSFPAFSPEDMHCVKS